jgi:ER protein Pkr1
MFRYLSIMISRVRVVESDGIGLKATQRNVRPGFASARRRKKAMIESDEKKKKVIQILWPATSFPHPSSSRLPSGDYHYRSWSDYSIIHRLVVMVDEPADDGHVGGGENTSQRLGSPRSESSESPSPAADSSDNDLLSNILAPGSSLNPNFLLVVDVVLALLSLTLGSLAIITGGNVHLILLLFIALALWVSIKWWAKNMHFGTV